MSRSHVILGKRWKIEYVYLPPTTDGMCDPPDKKGKTIRIHRPLLHKPFDLLVTLLHEGIHACGWNLAEDYVEQAALDLALMLWKEGFRLDAKGSQTKDK